MDIEKPSGAEESVVEKRSCTQCAASIANQYRRAAGFVVSLYI
jgi:hypothetical protein